MRTIKFRGKRLDNGEWVYGDLVHGHSYILVVPIKSYIDDNYTVIPETVGQFTGLFDKDGAEIYEGDFLHNSFDANSPYVIQWNEEKALFELGENGENLRRYGLNEFWEVTGNNNLKTSNQ